MSSIPTARWASYTLLQGTQCALLTKKSCDVLFKVSIETQESVFDALIRVEISVDSYGNTTTLGIDAYYNCCRRVTGKRKRL